MDVTTALALAAAINHEIPPLWQQCHEELMLDRERKAMQLEDLAVQGVTGSSQTWTRASRRMRF